MTKQYKAGCRIKISSADKMGLNSLNVDLEIYAKEIHGKIKEKKKCLAVAPSVIQLLW